VKINCNEYFPADLILLQSSNSSGLAYIETKNLDGETNLKHKEAVKETQESISDGAYATGWKARVVCEKPNDKLYKFEGTLQTESDLFSLDHTNLLLRGSSLKNTDWCYGLVVYTGHETRVMMNSSSSRIKFSNLELGMNKQIMMLFLFQIFICLIGATMSEILTASYGPQHNSYLRIMPTAKDPNKNPFVNALLKFGTWMLLFANLVPISLIVSMELVKFFQAQYIQWDITVYDTEKDLPCKVQTSNLNEQLGQVDYIFSDKTGTLTCNIMTYKKMSIGKYSYGVDKPVLTDCEEKDVTNFGM
jgi:phospholipid-transporting ATPase